MTGAPIRLKPDAHSKLVVPPSSELLPDTMDRLGVVTNELQDWACDGVTKLPKVVAATSHHNLRKCCIFEKLGHLSYPALALPQSMKILSGSDLRENFFQTRRASLVSPALHSQSQEEISPGFGRPKLSPPR
jgi:hypothetical protein